MFLKIMQKQQNKYIIPFANTKIEPVLWDNAFFHIDLIIWLYDERLEPVFRSPVGTSPLLNFTYRHTQQP